MGGGGGGGYRPPSIADLQKLVGEQYATVYAELHGVQIGLLNYAGNNARYKWLPIVNAHF